MKSLNRNSLKVIPLYLTFLLIWPVLIGKTQNTPVTSIGIITNATTTPGATVVPITVKDFESIGAFTLTIRYRLQYGTYVSANPHPSFPGMTISHSTSGNYGKLIINWPQTPGGVTLPDETHLVDLNFTYISGNCHVIWLFTPGNVCQFKRYSNGSYITLDDLPKQSHYLNGGFSNRGAPQMILPVINNPVPGTLEIPVTVNNFTGVGANSVTIEFNGNVLEWDTCSKNSLLVGTFNSGVQVGSNGNMALTISFTANTAATLANGATAYIIKFNYSTSNGTGSILNFIDPGCESADQTAWPFFENPASTYYFNGLIYTQYSPRVWLPVITDATPSGSLSLPVNVEDFNNVRSFNLSFEYDPTVLTYSGFTPDPEFGTDLNVTDIISGSLRKIVMTWNGTSDKTLPDGSHLANINFSYISGTTSLTWISTDGTSCRFNDSNGKAFYDWPKTGYYQDGMVASHVAPVTIAGQMSAGIGQQVTVPVITYGFSNIGRFTLTLDYDPSVLTYQGASLVPAIGGTFTASTAGLGRIMMDWSGSSSSLADSTKLINLNFIYNGGATTLAWFDGGDSCRYSESIVATALYDLPQSEYFVNGYVGPSTLTAGFIASSTSGDLSTTFTLTDQSTGSPTTWNWIISPSTYCFVNGTSSSSQNPQVKFTANGAYTVTLIIGRGTTSAARIRLDYLHAGTAGLWTGITSSDWNTVSNWHNFLLPSNTVNVLIPSTAPNWPVFAGNLIIGGSHCYNLSLDGSSQLTINGSLTILGGSVLNFTGSGSLLLSGDWTNTGIFNCGTSTVTFTGTMNASVNDNGSTQDFYRIIVNKTPGKVTFLGDVTVLGDN